MQQSMVGLRFVQVDSDRRIDNCVSSQTDSHGALPRRITNKSESSSKKTQGWFVFIALLYNLKSTQTFFRLLETAAAIPRFLPLQSPPSLTSQMNVPGEFLFDINSSS